MGSRVVLEGVVRNRLGPKGGAEKRFVKMRGSRSMEKKKLL